MTDTTINIILNVSLAVLAFGIVFGVIYLLTRH
jgi:uncharacterized membrane protein